MCFFTTASFAAGKARAAIGVLTLRRVRKKHQNAFGAIPIVFRVQQLSDSAVTPTFGAWTGYVRRV